MTELVKKKRELKQKKSVERERGTLNKMNSFAITEEYLPLIFPVILKI